MSNSVMEDAVPRCAPTSAMDAMKRGLLGRCPACGEGRMFRAYLKVADECPACGEELHHHRADDLPAYLVIVIVGHIVVPLVLGIETRYAPDYWVHFALWPALTLGLSFGMLQPVKGAVVGLQWFMGMDGFAAAKKKREYPAALASADAR
jgi:uncharacterized protein (DUF983 family)